MPDAPANEAGVLFIFAFGTQRHFAAPQDLVAIGGIADIAKHPHRKLFGATYLHEPQ
jgi:hypothetical protein